MSTSEKNYFARVYHPTVSGTTTSGLIGTLKDFIFNGFNWKINAGLGETVLRFPRTIESFGENEEIALFNQFDIYVNDRESSSEGELVYSGYCIEYTPHISPGNEYVDVVLWGYATEFALKMLETGTDTTLSYSSQDPADILRDVINRYDGKIATQLAAQPVENFQTTVNFDSENSSADWIAGTGVRMKSSTVTESFSSTGRKDASQTTANWDTATGSVKFPFSADVLDQSQTAQSQGVGWGGVDSYNNYEAVAQKFTAASDGYLSKVVFKIERAGSPTDQLVCALYSDNAGSPGSLLTSVTIDPNTLTPLAGLGEFSISFGKDYWLTSGTPYWIVFDRTGSNDSNYYFVMIKTSGSGTAKVYRSGSWSNSWDIGGSSVDLYFKEYYATYDTSANRLQTLSLDNLDQNISKVDLSVTSSLPGTASVAYEVSVDGGNTWESITPGSTLTVAGTGSDLRLRATLAGTTRYTPDIQAFTITAYGGTSAVAQSKSYDTGVSNPTYESYSTTKTLPFGTSITLEFSDSADNVNWSVWTTDITSLSRRYIRFRATLTTDDTTVGPTLSRLAFSVSGGSLNRTDTEVSYTFKQNTILEAIEQCVKMAPAYWYWRVGADNQLVFDVRNTNQVDHYLTIGKDIKSLSLTRSARQLVNGVYFLGGGDPVYIKSDRTSSQRSYGKRVWREQDERVTVQSTAEAIATNYLDNYDHPALIVQVSVIDSNGDSNGGYDIESFKPGQIVQLINPAESPSDTNWDVASWDVDFWDFPVTSAIGVPFQIVEINYGREETMLTLAYEHPDLSKRIEDIKRNLENTRTKDSPSTPTVV